MLAADTHSARLSRRTPRVLAGVLSFAALVAPFGCATAPPAPLKPLAVAHEKKMEWMLQLEDQRLLKLPEPPPPPVVAPVKGQRPVPLPPPPESVPDLTKLATDADPRIRRRAAISMGRVGLSDAVPALTTLVADTDTDVRQAAGARSTPRIARAAMASMGEAGAPSRPRSRCGPRTSPGPCCGGAQMAICCGTCAMARPIGLAARPCRRSRS